MLAPRRSLAKGSSRRGGVPRGALVLVAAMPLAFAACNALTGAGDLEVKDGTGGGATGAGGSGAGTGGSTADTGGGGSSTDTTTGAGGDATTTTGAGAGGGATTTTGAGGGSSGCPSPCGANEYCEAATNTCVCKPGFVDQGGVCQAAAPGDPSTHTQQEVCDHWTQGHVVTEPNPLVASGMDCDPGTLKPAGIADTLNRINMFRWMVGLGPVTDDATMNDDAQQCANLEAWWDFNSPSSPHQPPSNSKCYTAAGGATAGQSNIAWGSGHPAQAIDQFMQDNGNATTMGHRRWILNPPLGPVGIGYWQTGGQYGNAECLRVFGTSGGGPKPSWVSIPNAGFTPITVAKWTWTFHGSLSGIASAQIAMVRVDDDTPLAVNVQTLQQGYAQDAISWTPKGWTPEVGKTYRVTVSGLGGGDVVYDVKPVTCN